MLTTYIYIIHQCIHFLLFAFFSASNSAINISRAKSQFSYMQNTHDTFWTYSILIWSIEVNNFDLCHEHFHGFIAIAFVYINISHIYCNVSWCAMHMWNEIWNWKLKYLFSLIMVVIADDKNVSVQVSTSYSKTSSPIFIKNRCDHCDVYQAYCVCVLFSVSILHLCTDLRQRKRIL